MIPGPPTAQGFRDGAWGCPLTGWVSWGKLPNLCHSNNQQLLGLCSPFY